MASNGPPTYFFNNIDFNSNYFSSPPFSPYLKKTVSDTATALETFSGGMVITNGLTVDTIVPTISASSPSQIGWTQGFVSALIDTATSSTGNYITWTGQSILTGIQLPIGVYLITISASTIVSAGITSGTIGQWSSGYNLGPVYSNGNRTSLQFINNANHPVITKTAGQYTQNWSQVIKTTNANYYLAGFVLVNITGVLVGGTMQNVINSYSLTRIG